MKLVCKKCNDSVKKVVLGRYEYEKGVVLEEVEAYECPRCHEFVFTEKQAEEVERRAESLKFHKFSFERKVTISGRSLVINIPEDITRHMKLEKGRKAKLIPLDDKSFLVEVK